MPDHLRLGLGSRLETGEVRMAAVEPGMLPRARPGPPPSQRADSCHSGRDPALALHGRVCRRARLARRFRRGLNDQTKLRGAGLVARGAANSHY